MKKGYLLFFKILLTAVFGLLATNVHAQSILEAEDAFFSSGIVDNKHPGFTGTGFVDTENEVGAIIEWFINLDSAAVDSLGFRYALGKNENRYMEVYVNDQLLDTIDFDNSGAFTTYIYKTVPANLDSGINRIKLLSVNQEGAPNVDHLRILSDTSDLPYFSLSVTSGGNGTVSKSISGDSAQAGARVTLTASPNPGFTFSEWSGDIDTTINPFSLLVDQPYSIQANFVNSLPAFPGAEGFGKNTTGGRGGMVLEVTNLNDNGPGSLRSAINTPGTRTIVFRVSGTIYLNSNLTINHDNLTIAGQTAPGDGICIANYPLNFSANNIIVRYIRARLGDVTAQETDAINCRNVENIILDHCTLSWGTDEVVSPYLNENFTMQWCLISESLYRSVHQKGDHGYGGIWGGSYATFHHNLIAHHSSRNPRFNGSRFVGGIPDHVDYRNNVIYNWGFNSAYGGEPSDIDGTKARINMVNNYYRPGPATSGGQLKYRIVEPSSNEYGFSDWYIDGNFVYGRQEATDDNWRYGVQDVTPREKDSMRVYTPFAYDIDTTHTAEVALEHVLSNSGAVLPRRDAVDRRIVHEVCTGTVTYGGVYRAIPSGIIDSQGDVGGWPTLNSTTPPVDTDQDGMPDTWEQAHGLDINDPEDRNGDDNQDGYTNLEEYLNSLVAAFEYVVRPIHVEASKVSNNQVEVSWEDIAEHEEGYILERSDAGGTYVVLDTLAANVTSYLDEGLSPATYEYRLRAFNAVDTTCYTEAVSVELATNVDKKELQSIEVYPNPFTNQVIVRTEVEKATSFQLDILNLQGQVVTSRKTGMMNAGLHLIDWEIPRQVGKGLYVLKIRTNEGLYVQRLLRK